MWSSYRSQLSSIGQKPMTCKMIYLRPNQNTSVSSEQSTYANAFNGSRPKRLKIDQFETDETKVMRVMRLIWVFDSSSSRLVFSDLKPKNWLTGWELKANLDRNGFPSGCTTFSDFRTVFSTFVCFFHVDHRFRPLRFNRGKTNPQKAETEIETNQILEFDNTFNPVDSLPLTLCCFKARKLWAKRRVVIRVETNAKSHSSALLYSIGQLF